MATKIDFQSLGIEIPKDLQYMGYIRTMGKALDAWCDENNHRGYMILACGENDSVKPPKGLDPSRVTGAFSAAFVHGGNRTTLTALMGLLMRESKDFQKFMLSAIKDFTTEEGK